MAGPRYLPDALAALAREPAMAALIREHGPPVLRRGRNPFQSLTRAIVYQQLSGKAAGTIYRRFCELFELRRATDCPAPEQVLAMPVARLRAAGLSQQKASYVHDLAAHFADGRIDPRRFARMDDDQLAATLIQVKGIGRWSVDMYLLFTLNRPDVLPVGDLGVQRGMQRYFRKRALPKPAEMLRLAEGWRPWRSIASWYMWRVSDAGLPDGAPRPRP